MANTNNMRRTHSSPGVYFKETEMTYSSKSLGITTLGVAGETLRGPAFQPITIESWRQFQNYFGGTSTEKYRGSQYPKYELPYIAKSYLEQSQQLEVVRVLGLSGVNAGPAWVLTATKNKLGEKTVYTKYDYTSSDEIIGEWILGENSFRLEQELSNEIKNVSETPSLAPDIYRKIIAYSRPEVTEDEAGTVGADRNFSSLSDLYENAHSENALVDGYARVESGLTYSEIFYDPYENETQKWVINVNDFYDFPSGLVPDSSSPDYLRVGNKCGYTKLDGKPAYNFIECYNWFNNHELVNSSFQCDGEEPDYVMVSESEYKRVVRPYNAKKLNDVNSKFYIGDVVYDGVYVYGWSGNEYVLITNDITSVTQVITHNGVTYNYLTVNTTSYCFNNGGYKYSLNDFPNIGEYIINDNDLYKYDTESSQYISEDDYSQQDYDVNVLPVIPLDKPTPNPVYNKILGYVYDLSTEYNTTPANYLIYYKTANDETGGAKDAFWTQADINNDNSREYAHIVEANYTKLTGGNIPSSVIDLGYNYNVINDVIYDLNVNVGEYVSLNTLINFHGKGTQHTYGDMVEIEPTFVDHTIYVNYKIESNSPDFVCYSCDEMTSKEKHDGNIFTFDHEPRRDEMEEKIIEAGFVPSAIMVRYNDNECWYKAEVEKTYFGLTPGDGGYYKIEKVYLSYIADYKDDEFYKKGKKYQYYQKLTGYKFYKIVPTYEYYSKTVVEVQEQEPDTECCVDSINTVVAVLRSRGEHKKAKFVRTPNEVDRLNGICNDIYSYDGVEYYAKKVELEPSRSMMLGDECNPGFSKTSGDFSVDSTNYGRFTIVVTTIDDEEKRYPVSLNPTDRNYIYNVIGGNPEEGETEIYVEELYDVALKQIIEEGKANAINKQLAYYPEVYIKPNIKPVNDILMKDVVTAADIQRRYLYSKSLSNGISGVTYKTAANKTYKDKAGKNGVIYTVEYVEYEGGESGYAYVCHCDDYDEHTDEITNPKEYIKLFDYNTDVDKNSMETKNAVKVLADDMFYIVKSIDGVEDVLPITFDMNNYREPFRYSSTPWIISEMKGDAENVELTKLFRFHTISDGSNSIGDVKISIENIEPEYGTFDVLIRDFNDTDYSPMILEKYIKCDLVPGSKNYIALKIGSFDGAYEPKSKYVTVEVNENDITEVSTPAGFMGYPVRDYSGVGVTPEQEIDVNKPWFKYNTDIDEDVRAKKQYFGVSDIVGIDTDILKYKGVEAYNGLPSGMSACFHLDSRILNGTPDNEGYIEKFGVKQKVSIDGIGGYTWVTVGMNNTTDYGIEPRIGDDATMRGTIYEDKKYRKFTVAMYGGWDGWDYYRTSRSNTNDFTYSNYRGSVDRTSGFGNTVNVLQEPEIFGLEAGAKCLNTDYYAYLGAIKQFANPKTIEINVLATPGIDYVNNSLLVDDVIEMVEEERADALYVVTTPDKPFGAGDSQSEMYSAEDAVYNLEGSDIDSNRVCTYYPWEKYYDDASYQYIFLPITRDVVKSIAYTDNITHPWYAPAGWNRGDISGVAPKRKLKVSETDILYDGRINYINSFAKEGDKIWGNKNLQIAESQMNRISTRRLLLRIKKLCDKACIGFIFDPNDASMAKSLESTLKAILDNIKSNRGIYDYRIEIDNSVEARDRLELPATIYIKPTKLVEYIDITAVVTPEGVQWN